MEEREKLEEENEILHENVASQQEKISEIIELLGDQHLDNEIRKKLAEIMRATSEKTATTKQETNIQTNSKTQISNKDEDKSKTSESIKMGAARTKIQGTDLTLSKESPKRFKQTARKSVQSCTPSKANRGSTRSGRTFNALTPNSDGKQTCGTLAEVPTGNG